MKIFRFLSIFLILSALAQDASAQSAIYACGHIRRHREVAIDNLRNSGYTTAILFNVNVEVDGSLTTDFTWSSQTAAEAGGIICRDGQYVFDSYQPFYIDDVKAIITPPTSVERLEICIGGWTNGSYGNIKKLIEKEGTGPESILYKNLKALKEALPQVEAINNDQEQDYDLESAIKFHQMLYDIGYKTTIAPYTRKTYWQQLVAALNEVPGTCDRIYLQIYGGGSSNKPEDWQVFGDVPMYVGFDCEVNSNRTTMNTNMTRWAQTDGVVGGFLWNYNSEDRNHNEWAANINRIFNGTITDNPVATVYGTSKFRGYEVSLEEGSYTQADLAVRGIAAKDISSFALVDGYKITLYKNNDLTGPSREWTESIEFLEDEWDNAACSLKIEVADSGVASTDEDLLTVNNETDEIHIKGLSSEDSILIYDIGGSLVFEKSNIGVSEYRIPKNKIPQGILILKISNHTFKLLN